MSFAERAISIERTNGFEGERKDEGEGEGRSKMRYATLTLIAKCAQMLDGELQDLRFLQFSAVRVPRGRRYQPPQLAEGRVDPVAALLLDHPPPAFPRRVLTGVSTGRVASANGNPREGLRHKSVARAKVKTNLNGPLSRKSAP